VPPRRSTLPSSGNGSIRIGCAGWALSAARKPSFPSVGTHLQRYASVFGTTEINSSFYRPHRRATYERWADSVPEDFRFTAKLPRTMTHERRLNDCGTLLDRFLDEASGLGKKLGALLVQLPPSLAYSGGMVRSFLDGMRDRYGGPVALEARHASWFTDEADALLRAFDVAGVAADPGLSGMLPRGSRSFAYFRLHGSPRMYYSAYSAEFLEALAARLGPEAIRGDVYCIFDNTAEGAAIGDAMTLMKKSGAGT
jgi:uncharacterized protein YecE (DUF72 family)